MILCLMKHAVCSYGLFSVTFIYGISFLCFTVVDSIEGRLDVQLDGPPWMLNGTSGEFQCKFNDAGFNGMGWYASDFNVSDPMQAQLLLKWNFRNNNFSGPEENRMTSIKQSDGVYQLHISEVSLNTDEKRYWCAATTSVNGIAHEGHSAKDSFVTVKPKSVKLYTTPALEVGNVLDVVVGSPKSLTCAVKGSKPASKIIWNLGESNVPPDRTQVNVTNPQDQRLTDSTSYATLTNVLWNQHGTSLSCSAIIPPNSMETTVNVQLNVKVPPVQSKVLLYDINNNSGYPNGSLIKVLQDDAHTALTCKTKETRPASDIEWFINGVKVTSGVSPSVSPSVGNDQLVDTTSSFTFTPTRGNHRQTVGCRASIPVPDSPASVGITVVLDVFGPPDTPAISGDTDLSEGINSSSITCTALNAYPGGSIVWFNKENAIIQAGGSNQTNSDRFNIVDTLVFSPHRRDNGEPIRCEVRHETLTGPTYPAITTNVNVKFCPNDVNIVECPSVVAGKNTTLSCTSSSSYPISSLQWYEDDKDVISGFPPSNPPAEFNGFSTTQQFTTRVVERADAGIISHKCCVKNDDAGCNDCSELCRLNVLYPPENVILTKSVNGTILEAEHLKLQCNAGGNPTPNRFTWRHDNNIINAESSELVFDKIVRADAGNYMCTAINGQESDGESNMVTIVVYYKSNISNKERNQIGVNEGDNVTLECIADALPKPEFTWFDRDGTKLSNASERIILSHQTLKKDDVHGTEIKSTLTITKVNAEKDYGEYKCIANNTIGQDVLIIHVNGTTVPRIVTDLRVLNITMTTIALDWIPGYSGGNDFTQFFWVAYRQISSALDWEEEKSSNQFYTISDLQPGTTYEIRVTPENVLGRGVSQDTEATTRSKPQNSDSSNHENLPIIIGGTFGAVFLLVIIGILLFILNRNPRKTLKGGSQSLRHNGSDNFGTTNADESEGQSQGTVIPLYAAVNKQKGADTNGPPVYAEVNKKKDNKSGTSKDVASTSSAYDNGNFQVSEGDPTYDDVENIKQEKKAASDDGRTVTEDGLVYQEVGHFKAHPPGAPPIQTEAETEYASLDFNRTAANKK